MDTMLIIFMIFAGIICLGTTAVIVLELISKIKSNKNANQQKTDTASTDGQSVVNSTVTTQSQLTDVLVVEFVGKVKTGKNVVQQDASSVTTVASPVEEPSTTEVVEQPTVATQQPAPVVAEPAQTADEAQTEAPDEENGVWIATSQSQTLEEKYLDLDAEQRGWYDEIERHAMTKEGIKHYKNNRYEDYKIGNQRIVRLTIKRGVIQCEFVLINQDFRNYIADNKVSVKTASTVIKVDSAEAVDTVKNSIDIAIEAAELERQYKKEKQKEKRKQARAAKNQ